MPNRLMRESSVLDLLARVPVNKSSLLKSIDNLLDTIETSESAVMIPTLLKDKCEFDAWELLIIAKILKASILGHSDLAEFYLNHVRINRSLTTQQQQQQQQNGHLESPIEFLQSPSSASFGQFSPIASSPNLQVLNQIISEATYNANVKHPSGGTSLVSSSSSSSSSSNAQTLINGPESIVQDHKQATSQSSSSWTTAQSGQPATLSSSSLNSSPMSSSIGSTPTSGSVSSSSSNDSTNSPSIQEPRLQLDTNLNSEASILVDNVIRESLSSIECQNKPTPGASAPGRPAQPPSLLQLTTTNNHINSIAAASQTPSQAPSPAHELASLNGVLSISTTGEAQQQSANGPSRLLPERAHPPTELKTSRSAGCLFRMNSSGASSPRTPTTPYGNAPSEITANQSAATSKLRYDSSVPAKLVLQIEQLKSNIMTVTQMLESVVELYKNSIDNIAA